MDGGTVWDINVSSAIEQCLEVVDDPADIVLDIMICSFDPAPKDIKHTWDWNTITYKHRVHKWSSYYRGSNSIQQAKAMFPTVDYRYLFQQKTPSANSLDFGNSTTWPLQEEGREDAQKALEDGEGVEFLRLEQWDKENEPRMQQ